MAVNIRAPIRTDLEILVDYIHAVYVESPRYRNKTFSEKKAYSMVEYFINTPDSGGFVAEKDGKVIGMVGGGIGEFLASDDKFVSDALIYIVPSQRGGSAFFRLISAFEKWAKSKGATEMILGISTDINADETVCIYERIGYKLASRSYYKKL